MFTIFVLNSLIQLIRQTSLQRIILFFSLMVILNNYEIAREAFLKRGDEFGDVDSTGFIFTDFKDGKRNLSSH